MGHRIKNPFEQFMNNHPGAGVIEGDVPPEWLGPFLPPPPPLPDGSGESVDPWDFITTVTPSLSDRALRVVEKLGRLKKSGEVTVRRGRPGTVQNPPEMPVDPSMVMLRFAGVNSM